MFKKIILLGISLFLLSCTSPFSEVGMKFKDRAGTYESKDKNIRVTVSKEDKQNLKILVYNVNGLGVINDTYDITPTVTTGNFTLKSFKYTYILNFHNNTALYFSVREGVSYKISEAELNNSSK